MNNLILCNVDTDSFSVCKPDQAPWTKEEKDNFIKDLNSQFPELIYWDDDGIYSKFLVLKSKNYVLVDETGKIKIKGSSLKDQKRPKMILQFINDFINILLEEKPEKLVPLYESYVKLTANIIDIKPWSKKLTITDKIFKCKDHANLTKEEKKEAKLRKNETDVYDALKDRQVQEGDKIWVYFNNNGGLSMVEDWAGDYDRKALLKNLFTATQIFKNVIDPIQFKNYTLKKNKIS